MWAAGAQPQASDFDRMTAEAQRKAVSLTGLDDRRTGRLVPATVGGLAPANYPVVRGDLHENPRWLGVDALDLGGRAARFCHSAVGGEPGASQRGSIDGGLLYLRDRHWRHANRRCWHHRLLLLRMCMTGAVRGQRRKPALWGSRHTRGAAA